MWWTMYIFAHCEIESHFKVFFLITRLFFVVYISLGIRYPLSVVLIEIL